jgi:hypothetical protein
MKRLVWLALLLASESIARSTWSAEILRLTPENWSAVPAGKEVDAIYGDYLVRNDKVVAIIADPVPSRNANVSVQNVQGAVTDFTLREANNDQLTAFLAQGQRWHQNVFEHDPAATQAAIIVGRVRDVRLRVRREPTSADPVEVVTDYSLRDGDAFLRATTRHRNTGDAPFQKTVSDKMRCDLTFTQITAADSHAIIFYDKWFRAAYGVVRREGTIHARGSTATLWGPNNGVWLDYPDHLVGDDRQSTTIAPGQEIVLDRYLIMGRHPAKIEREAERLLRRGARQVRVLVKSQGRSVEGAELIVQKDEITVTEASTDSGGQAVLSLPPGEYRLTVSQMGRATRQTILRTGDRQPLRVEMGPRAAVSFDITDESGRPSPCKAQFLGADGTPDPELGPIQRANGCRNLYMFAHGKYVAPLPPGRYHVILSRGPEYDAVYRDLDLKAGQTATIAAQFRRVVNSAGWIAADFHNHTSESGDNVSDPDGRLVSMAAEGVEFAVSSEHNRIQSFRPRIRSLGLESLLATADGVELSGRPGPGPLNHQNAFPLRPKPGLQDGGAPQTHNDPAIQIERLFNLDDWSEKLVQQNHPDIGWLYFDKDGDGRLDGGFGTAPFTHVMEVRLEPTQFLNMKPEAGRSGKKNRFFEWLQMLNQGFRLYGTTNSDSHSCFNESGRNRNYVRSRTDDPARIDEVDVMREAKKGHLVMSNGPFMEVTLNGALPGDVIAAEDREVLYVRVQCANWQSIDRIQVLINGRPDPELNFMRSKHPELFTEGAVQFEHSFEIHLAADAHVIVAAVGEQTPVALVMGKEADAPFAISNPIFVDVDGNGFDVNKDTLDAPLPVKQDRAQKNEDDQGDEQAVSRRPAAPSKNN